MSDQAERNFPPLTEPETSADFLVKLSKALHEKEGVDTGLVDILEKYLLTDAPTIGAVAQAKDAIQKLASERANPVKSEVAGG